MKLYLKTLLGMLLTLLGIWILIPKPDHSSEDLQSICRLRSGTVIRFFIGDGGATVGPWYSITEQTGGYWSEREVFYIYGDPEITGVTCNDDIVTVSSEHRTWTLDAVLLAPDTLPSEYWRRPDNDRVSVREGKMFAPGLLGGVVGICALVGGLMVIPLRRRRAAEHAVAADGRPQTAARR